MTFFGERVTAEVLGLREADPGKDGTAGNPHENLPAGSLRKLRVRFLDASGKTHTLLVDEWPGAQRAVAAGTVDLVYDRRRTRKTYVVNRSWPKSSGVIVAGLLGAILLVCPLIGVARLYSPLGGFLSEQFRPLLPQILRGLPLILGAMFTRAGLLLMRDRMSLLQSGTRTAGTSVAQGWSGGADGEHFWIEAEFTDGAGQPARRRIPVAVGLGTGAHATGKKVRLLLPGDPSSLPLVDHPLELWLFPVMSLLLGGVGLAVGAWLIGTRSVAF